MGFDQPQHYLVMLRNLIKMQNLRPHPRPAEAESYLTRSPGDSCGQEGPRSTVLEDEIWVLQVGGWRMTVQGEEQHPQSLHV